MKQWPRISIVTPSFNQGIYIKETVESVLAQDYPNLEHIVIDGCSTDDTLEILKRYPHLKLISEPDRGQAEAVNKGFRLATGDIWGYLNSDDTLLPGALHRVAQEIDPASNRHIVMGRCRFIDEHGHFIGVEHPSHFESHRRVLEIWKGHMIPQPSVFWTPEVWRACGPMDENLGSAWLDYDLFCRFSQKYCFHFVDQLFSTYRLHTESKTQQQTEAKRLEECIGISSRYWGTPFSSMYWQLTLSLAWYRFNRTGRARDWLRQSQEASRTRRAPPAVAYTLAAAMLAPEVVFYMAVYPFLKERARGVVGKVLTRLAEGRGVYPQTAIHFDHTQPWADDWIGPRLVISRQAEPDTQTLVIQGWVELRYLSQPFTLTVRVDEQEVGQHRLTQNGNFTLTLPLSPSLPPGPHTVEVQANAYFVPHRFARNEDFRPLAWRLISLDLA